MKQSAIKDFFQKNQKYFEGRVRIDVSMSSYTTFHCQGSSDVIYNPRHLQDLSKVIKELTGEKFIFRKDWNMIGRGSNVLIADEGYRGCLIDLSGDFQKIKVVHEDSNTATVKAEAGVANGAFLQYLRSRDWEGFEFAFGIPGCIGGGIRMNAGTPQGWFSEVLEKVELMDVNGAIKEIPVNPTMFTYRDFPLAHNQIVLSGTFIFNKSNSLVIRDKIKVLKDQRKNQPLDFPNIGSVFKNPEGNFAGKLIQDAGLKGFTIGNAQISEKHANFIVNLGGAKTKDVLALIQKAQKEVKNQFGIELEPEVHWIG
jgi:UDP-N-acetylmuramate dehydrogenase